MSYARFIDSDVYVFATTEGTVECMSCWLQPSTRPENLIGYETHVSASLPDMIAHLALHRAAGYNVDDDTFRELLEDYLKIPVASPEP